MENPIILIAGIPGSGKSSYAAWLQEHKGFLHIDLDEDEGGLLESAELKSFRDAAFEIGSAKPLVESLSKLSKPIVVDWGFPARYLGVVSAFKSAGMQLWWFDGDRMAARQAFLRRGTVPVEALDAQMASIDESWFEIQRVFDSQVIETVSPGPRFLPPDSIFGKMFP